MTVETKSPNSCHEDTPRTLLRLAGNVAFPCSSLPERTPHAVDINVNYQRSAHQESLPNGSGHTSDNYATLCHPDQKAHAADCWAQHTRVES